MSPQIKPPKFVTSSYPYNQHRKSAGANARHAEAGTRTPRHVGAIAAPALAVAAIAMSLVGVWPGSAAAQVTTARTVSVAASAGSRLSPLTASEAHQEAWMSAQKSATVIASQTGQFLSASPRAIADRAAALMAADGEKPARARARHHASPALASKQSASSGSQSTGSQSNVVTSAVPAGSPQQIAQAMLASYGWSASQFSCLDPLWQQESGWNTYAENAGSGAYGIPQALPGSKMASAGPDWQTDPTTQIRWGLNYIQSTYGSPCAAWDHEQATGWY